MKKNIGIEILRIISMLMVLVLHCFNHGNVFKNLSDFSFFNKTAIVLFESMSIVAVNTFVLISGYNLWKKDFKKERIINIITKVWIINFIICFLMFASGEMQLNLKNIIITIFPVLSQEYWFVNSYIFLLLFTPFLNKFIKSLEKKEYNHLIVLSLIINCLIPIFTKNSVSMPTGYSLFWFMNVYIIGAYLNKYDIKISRVLSSLSYLFLSCLISIAVLIVTKQMNLQLAMNFYDYNNILVLLSSVSLFLIFNNFSINNKINDIILFFSKSSFSVYLITENIFFRPYLWNKLVDTFNFSESYFYIFIILFYIFIIFVSCIFLDKIINCLISYLNKIVLNLKKRW